MKWLVTFIFVMALVWLVMRATTRSNALKLGQPAPDFELPDQYGTVHTLPNFRGRWLVLYFYPKDDTPGCTTQACAFRDDLQVLDALGATVIGISVDNTSSHADFAKKYNLDFPLLADDKAEIASRYCSLVSLGVAKFAKRNTFLIDPQGCIAKVYLSASTKDNSANVIEDLKKLKVIQQGSSNRNEGE